MADEEREFSHESFQDRDSIVKYLEALRESLQQGRLLLTCNGERFALELPSLVKFDVQAKQKRNRAQLVLKMSWKHQKSAKELRVEPLLIEAEDNGKVDS